MLRSLQVTLLSISVPDGTDYTTLVRQYGVRGHHVAVIQSTASRTCLQGYLGDYVRYKIFQPRQCDLLPVLSNTNTASVWYRGLACVDQRMERGRQFNSSNIVFPRLSGSYDRRRD